MLLLNVKFLKAVKSSDSDNHLDKKKIMRLHGDSNPLPILYYNSNQFIYLFIQPLVYLRSMTILAIVKESKKDYAQI